MANPAGQLVLSSYGCNFVDKGALAKWYGAIWSLGVSKDKKILVDVACDTHALVDVVGEEAALELVHGEALLELVRLGAALVLEHPPLDDGAGGRGHRVHPHRHLGGRVAEALEELAVGRVEGELVGVEDRALDGHDAVPPLVRVRVHLVLVVGEDVGRGVEDGEAPVVASSCRIVA